MKSAITKAIEGLLADFRKIIPGIKKPERRDYQEFVDPLIIEVERRIVEFNGGEEEIVLIIDYIKDLRSVFSDFGNNKKIYDEMSGMVTTADQILGAIIDEE